MVLTWNFLWFLAELVTSLRKCPQLMQHWRKFKTRFNKAGKWMTSELQQGGASVLICKTGMLLAAACYTCTLSWLSVNNIVNATLLRCSWIELLPDDVLVQIFQKLDPQSFRVVQCCCRSLKMAATRAIPCLTTDLCKHQVQLCFSFVCTSVVFILETISLNWKIVETLHALCDMHNVPKACWT